MATLGCLAVGIAAGVGFVAVEKRVKVPLLDLALLRNRVLVGSTVAILIGAGTINALMYLLSLYFQDPATLGFSPLQAGLATLPATAGLVAVAPLVPRLAAKFGGRTVVGAGFAITAVGFAVIGINQSSWGYVAFVLPLIAVAVGYGDVQRAGIVSRDRRGPGRPGRGGFGRVEHGALRRGRCGDRPRRVHLQLGHRPADCCRCGTRGSACPPDSAPPPG